MRAFLASRPEDRMSGYNSDFITKNFVPQLRGIFTLGETETEILTRIEAAKTRVKGLEDDVAQLQVILGADEAPPASVPS